MEFQLEYSAESRRNAGNNSSGIPSLTLTEIPSGIVWNSAKIPAEFQWNSGEMPAIIPEDSGGFQAESTWNPPGIPDESRLEFRRNPSGIPGLFLLG